MTFGGGGQGYYSGMAYPGAAGGGGSFVQLGWSTTLTKSQVLAAAGKHSKPSGETRYSVARP